MTERTKSVKLNMIMNMLLTMSNFIFPLVTFPYVSRILLPVGTGKVILATSVISYFAMFAQLGIPTYGVISCAKVRNNKEELSRVVHELLFINLFMTIIVYIIYGVVVFSVPKFKNEIALYLIMSLTIILNSIGVEWLYRGLEKYTYITIRSLIFKFIALIAMFALVHNINDYVIYGTITIFAASASNILNFINLKKYIFIRPVGKYNYKKHIKMILVFFAMTVAATIYTNLDNIMLGFMKDDVAVGYYGAAVKIKNILLSIVTSASTVLLPRASFYVKNGDMNEFYRILRKTMHFIVLVAFSFSIYFIMFAKEGIIFLSGKEYIGAITPMQIIMPTLLLIGITNVIGVQMMIPLGMEKYVLYSEIAGAVVDLILNTIFIPKFGASGAAFGTLIAELVVLIWQITAIKSIPAKIFKDVPAFKIFIAISIASVGTLWVKLLSLKSFFVLAISGICFFGIYVIALLFIKDSIIDELLSLMIKKMKKQN